MYNICRAAEEEAKQLRFVLQMFSSSAEPHDPPPPPLIRSLHPVYFSLIAKMQIFLTFLITHVSNFEVESGDADRTVCLIAVELRWTGQSYHLFIFPLEF